MKPNLSSGEVDALLESIEYSKDRLRNAAGPYDARREKLERLDAATAKQWQMRESR